jgi:phospholipid/cholesterol/gamma-HCH transport system ATP-binding protein
VSGASSGAAGAIIACEGVGVRLGGAWVLRDVTFACHAGEVLGLIGPGGHGKSVLLKLVAGLLRPDEGRVSVLGRDLARLSARELAEVRESLGYLFQNYALFDFMTVRDNVAFPLRQMGRHSDAAIAAAVQEMLATVGLGHALDLLPSQLSGGMKKRVGLARAVITEAPVILYDDPSAGLDPVTSSKIFQLIAAMHARSPHGCALVVSHDIDRMKVICDRYLMIHRGRVLFEGPQAAIAAADPLVGAFFFGAVDKAAGLL